MRFRIFGRVKKKDFLSYLMEVFIVIFGITIAYQLNVFYEDQKDLKLEKAAIEKLQKENLSNINEFQSLLENRFKIEDDTRQLARILFSGGNLADNNLSQYLFDINRTFKPYIQLEGMNFYLNSNYTDKNTDLKNELISLKNLYVELKDLVARYMLMKEKYYSEFLISEVDFGEERILSFEKIKSVEFKNLVVSILSHEINLNSIFETAYQKSVDIDALIAQKLGNG